MIESKLAEAMAQVRHQGIHLAAADAPRATLSGRNPEGRQVRMGRCGAADPKRGVRGLRHLVVRLGKRARCSRVSVERIDVLLLELVEQQLLKEVFLGVGVVHHPAYAD